MSILVFTLSAMPAMVLGLQGEGSAAANGTSSTFYYIKYASVITAIVVLFIMLLTSIAFCFGCCCFKKYDYYFVKRKEARIKAMKRNNLVNSHLVDSSCVIDIGNEIDNVNRNIDIVFTLVKNEFVLIDKAYSLLAHILVKSYFVLNPAKNV